jgi:hypothetical protein
MEPCLKIVAGMRAAVAWVRSQRTVEGRLWCQQTWVVEGEQYRATRVYRVRRTLLCSDSLRCAGDAPVTFVSFAAGTRPPFV